MNDQRLPTFVSTAWLHERLDAPDVRVIDATWFLPTDPRDAQTTHEAARIPGAAFFPIDEIADHASDLPHMLPDAVMFAAAASALGVGDGDRVVCYDAHGIYSAPRVWWTFRAFGHHAVTILDGGLPRWRAEGRPVETGPPALREPSARGFTARRTAHGAVDHRAVRANIDRPRFQLVDVRSTGRFRGGEPEPRPGLRAGHVPGSRNVPWADLLTADGATLRPPEELRARLVAAGVDPAGPVVATCGSGLTAAILAAALDVLGGAAGDHAAPAAAIYDGSWAEWGALADAPVETGPV